jgi:hypothetical protein
MADMAGLTKTSDTTSDLSLLTTSDVWFKNDNTIKKIDACTNTNGVLKSLKLNGFTSLSQFGPEKGEFCMSNDAPKGTYVSATLYWGSTQVVAIALESSDKTVQQYGNLATATDYRKTLFSDKMQPIGLHGL